MINKEPLVSIIIPLYNAEQFISKTLDSVKNQVYTHFEVWIINDNSTDNSFKIANEYAKNDNRFHLINLYNNSGVSNARNIGIKAASGEYIAFLDSDDIWTKDKLYKQIKYMIINDISFSCTSYRMFENESTVGKIIYPNQNITYDILLHGNQIACSTVVLKKKLLDNDKFEKCNHEDYLLWLNILKKGITCHGLKNVLGYYRKSSKSLSGNKFKAALWTWNILYKKENIGLMKSIYCFLCYIINAIKKHG